MNYWLFKSDPTCCNYDDILKCKNHTRPWVGVRNYQARNFIRDGMKAGDKGIFYHSCCCPPHAVGTVIITKESYPDCTAWDSTSRHFDEKSNPENPRWFSVDMKAEKKFSRTVPIQEMRQFSELANMQLLVRGNRLSVMPIEKKHYDLLVQLGR